MLDTKRYWFKDLEKLIGNVFGPLPLTPNQYTYLSGFLALISFFFIIKQQLLIALIFFVLAGFLDLVDGAVARIKNISSKKGAYLDTIFDRYVEAIILFGFLFLPLPLILFPAKIWIFLTIFGFIMTDYAKAAAVEKGLSIEEIKGGILSRGERLILIFTAIILGIIYPNYIYTTYIVIILAVFSNITAIQRMCFAIKKNGKN